ncbi:MAG: 2,3-bisphosphoglycerate-dependent phosphoglycerate mutase, partial [Epsilonproteobacteria bacterium]|nr:2,3-bisphosphoglycerate-dependent phosphoglycerate mutase [Campylobacterota bacterium]
IDPDYAQRYPLEPKYENIGYHPRSESLKDTRERVVEYFFEEITPSLLVYDTVMIAAHGNSLRALIMFLENVAPEEVHTIEIPTGTPIVYDLTKELAIIDKTVYNQ